MRLRREEEGQAVVEFALIGMAVMMLMVGLVDVGRAFFQYNAMSAAARYAARWGSVAGGTCALPYSARSSNDWCNQLGSSSGNFWSQSGNAPLQGAGTVCPSYTSNAAAYYTVSNFVSTSSTTIVGAVAQRFDTNSGSTNFVQGKATPGFDLRQLKVCVETSTTNTIPQFGDRVGVTVYYAFTPAGKLFPTGQFPMDASSQYVVE